MAMRRQHHGGSSSMAAALNPSISAREDMRKRGVQPKNHAKDNLRAIREIEQRNKERQQEEEGKQNDLWKLAEYREVKSKVAEAKANPSNSGENTHRNFTRKGSSENRHAEQMRIKRENAQRLKEETRKLAEDVAAHDRAHASGGELRRRQSLAQRDGEQPSSIDGKAKPHVPRATETNQTAPKTHKNFIVQNRLNAVDSTTGGGGGGGGGTKGRLSTGVTRRSDSIGVGGATGAGGPDNNKHEEFGKLPKYLKKRQEGWAKAEEDRIASLPDPECPPGMRKMSEEERLETLRLLDESEQECRATLFRIPLTSDAPSTVRRREELDKKLKEIEDARRIFSKPKIFVKN